MKLLTAQTGKVFAYKDDNNQEIVLGSVIYLGVNDDGSRYYEIDEPVEEKEENKE